MPSWATGVIVSDEPDRPRRITQAHVLQTVSSRNPRDGCGLVSHDLAVVAEIASRVVAFAGASSGRHESIFTPGHLYTRKLVKATDVAERHPLEAAPGRVPAPARAARCVFAPRCDYALPACLESPPPAVELGPGHLVRCIRVAEIDRGSAATALQPRPETSPAPLVEAHSIDAFHGPHHVLHHVSLALGRGECLALVGESGSGKTTLARVIVGSTRPARATFCRCPPTRACRSEAPIEACRRLQYVFHSPHNALNPRRSIGRSCAHRSPLLRTARPGCA
jgi:peptide/nickel transport system ATP-binding protein